MQQDQVVKFFTYLIILLILLMLLSVVAIPELVSMIEESCSKSSENELLNTRMSTIEIKHEETPSSVFHPYT